MNEYRGAAKVLAWAHLVLGNVGVAGVAILAMIGGYLGGPAMQPQQFGGMGWNAGQVHLNILQYYEQPRDGLLLVALSDSRLAA